MEIEEIRRQLDKKYENFKKEVREFFESALKVVCDKYPDIEVSFVQYTPYFNDGDSCEFEPPSGIAVKSKEFEKIIESIESKKDKYFDIDDFMDDMYIDAKWEGSAWGINNYIESYDESEYPELHKEANRLLQIEKEFEQVIIGHPDDLYLDLFGNHVEVTIKNGEITKDYYEHD